jgi:antitoxin HicB
MMTKTSRSKTTPKPHDLDYFMSLPYPMELHEEEDGFTALYPDLPGCVSYGDTPNDAVQRLKVTKRLWIEGKLEAGFEIPLPSETPEFSGKFVLRIPRDLHAALHAEAAHQGTSLNQYVGHVLACRHAQTKLDMNEVVANISASILPALTQSIAASVGSIVTTQKAQYFHGFEKNFLLDAKKADFNHIGYLAVPSDSFDYVVSNPEYKRKALYSDEHPHVFWTERGR